jgi:chemotaxis protein CheD
LKKTLISSHINLQKAALQPSIFAQTGIPLLIKMLNGVGLKLGNMRAFAARGANMSISCDFFKMRQRNTQSVQMILRNLGIPLIHCISGNMHNSTLLFHLKAGAVALGANNNT